MSACSDSVFVCLLSLATGLLISMSSWAYASVYDELNSNTPLAHQILRQAKSAGMRSYINASVEPCDDFYGYACGNYGRINPATESKISFDLFDDLTAGYQRRVLHLLKEPKISTDSGAEMRVKYFYESCLNTTSLKLQQRPHLLALMKEFGGLPALEGNAWNESNFDAIEMMAQLLHRFGKVTLLNVEVMPGLANSQTNRLFLGQRNDLPAPRAYILYNILEQQLRKNLNTLIGVKYSNAFETARSVVEVSSQLAEAITERKDEQRPDQTYRLKMLDAMSESYGPALNLTRFVQAWLKHDYHLPVYEYPESYLWQLKKVLIKTPNHVLANYMLSSLLSDYDIEPSDDAVEQEKLCAQKTCKLFAEYVNHMVYRSLEKQNPDIPGSIRQLWQELKISFFNMLRSPNNSWLDEQTLKEALAKLKMMSFQMLGANAEHYENYYSTLIIATDDYFGNVQRILELQARHLRDKLQRPVDENIENKVELSPVYYASFNRVVIPASFMQHRYFFDDAYPMALKYGTLGYILAHEMAHAFDDLSGSFDAQGNLRDWWTHEAMQQFEQRKKCLINQFDGFKYDGENLRRGISQFENIADNVGVRIAHAAYNNWLQPSTLETETLPHMSHTEQQLFFLALGQVWCSDVLADYRSALANDDEHAPEQIRVHAMMGNLDAFAEAYGCPEGSKMNFTKKCAIY